MNKLWKLNACNYIHVSSIKCTNFYRFRESVIISNKFAESLGAQLTIYDHDTHGGYETIDTGMWIRRELYFRELATSWYSTIRPQLMGFM